MLARVEDAFSERSVFVTGASGFLGKALLEKILFALPSVKRVYVLIRPSRGKTAQERLDDLFQGPLFARTRQSNPNALKKVVAIEGDLMDENLGASARDWETLIDDVNIVIHCAATVKFDEPLRTALNMNVEGTRRIIELCRQIKHLQCFVHASTAYANCQRQTTREHIYKLAVTPDEIRAAAQWMDDAMLASLTPFLLNGRPNTYTFTKAIAEMCLEKEADGLPVVIVRPSIIGAAWQDPLPGWTDNVNGATGIFVANSKGLLTNMVGDPDARADIIPVDVVANMLLAAVWHHTNHPTHAVTGERTTPIRVMHCASGELNPLSWRLVVDFGNRFYKTYPATETFGVPSARFHKTRLMFEVAFHAKHVLPAYLLDILARARGHKAILRRVYSKIRRMASTLEYFMTHDWSFESRALVSLYDAMSEDDQRTFNFDVRQLDWHSYLFDYMMGAKLYVLKDRLEDLPKAKANLDRVRMASYAVHILGWYIGYRLMGRRNTSFLKRWSWILGGAYVTFWGQHNGIRAPVRMKSLDDYRAQSQSIAFEETDGIEGADNNKHDRNNNQHKMRSHPKHAATTH